MLAVRLVTVIWMRDRDVAGSREGAGLRTAFSWLFASLGPASPVDFEYDVSVCFTGGSYGGMLTLPVAFLLRSSKNVSERSRAAGYM